MLQKMYFACLTVLKGQRAERQSVREPSRGGGLISVKGKKFCLYHRVETDAGARQLSFNFVSVYLIWAETLLASSASFPVDG